MRHSKTIVLDDASDAMAPETLHAFARLIYDKSGIKLGANKEALMHARIRKRMRRLQIDSFEEYLKLVTGDQTGRELVELIDAISTNVTHFFREERHFEVLARAVRRWADAGQSRLRIWSAAASTGEEPYSIAMTLCETLQDLRDVKILATDISTNVLRKAQAGFYEARHVEKVPPAILRKYFLAEENGYRICEKVRQMVTFGRINLATPPYPLHGPLDVIFCRNVMIYFDNEVRRRVLETMHKLLRPGGYLMVGHAESLSGMLVELKSVEPSVYMK